MNKTRITTGLRDIVADDDVPEATETGWYKCEYCDNLHVVLKDEDGEPIATMRLDEEMLLDMLRTLHGGVPS